MRNKKRHLDSFRDVVPFKIGSTIFSLMGTLRKNMLIGAHKRFERARHTEKYLLDLKANRAVASSIIEGLIFIYSCSHHKNNRFQRK